MDVGLIPSLAGPLDWNRPPDVGFPAPARTVDQTRDAPRGLPRAAARLGMAAGPAKSDPASPGRGRRGREGVRSAPISSSEWPIAGTIARISPKSVSMLV